jgi:hypothetical protein
MATTTQQSSSSSSSTGEQQFSAALHNSLLPGVEACETHIRAVADSQMALGEQLDRLNSGMCCIVFVFYLCFVQCIDR